ncbi:hypothetical protein [Cerasicoccus maritimus]|uniref:hypothetical protein n=1 Tax=Cerasicoccus maritimus TaxID=490089 RepID=UPI0028525662|nr:hypothetical protein [Cerasicoccus maritimus]
MSFAFQVRNFIRANRFAYALIRFVRCDKKRWPCKSTCLTIEGYPRSANTFTYHFVTRLYPAEKIASHYHNIAALKESMRLGIPTVVLVREPLGAVVSLAQMNRCVSDVHAVGNLLEEWILYYSYVLSVASEIRVVSFQSVTEFPAEFARMLGGLLHTSLDDTQIDIAVNATYESMRLKEANKCLINGSLPSSVRNGEKTILLDQIRKLNRLASAQELYVKLTMSGDCS